MNDAKTIRRRALRAAQTATLGLVLATGGCYATHQDGPDPILADGGALEDGGVDAGSDGGVDSGIAAMTCDVSGADWAACCEAIDWDWDRGCAAWGPFVPPTGRA